MPLVYTDNTLKTAFTQTESDNLIAQAMAGAPILDKKGEEWYRISAEREADARQQIADRIANAPTADEVWTAEADRLDAKLVSLGSLARTIEDLATDGAVSQARKDLLAPVIAARVAHRLVKPA